MSGARNGAAGPVTDAARAPGLPHRAVRRACPGETWRHV